MNKINRRTFVKGTSAAIATSPLLPRFSIAQSSGSPNDKLNIAVVGVGGRGWGNLQGCSGENIVALCDVSEESAANAFDEYPNARRFKDFRVMLDTMEDEIDAVVVATPDHTHFVATMDAMQRGKHVYIEKPLTHNIWQARTLRKATHYYNVVSQMGNQGHAGSGIRTIKEWTAAGVLGDVSQVDAWLPGPGFTGRYFLKPAQFPLQPEPVPAGLDWDLWQGPAEERAYNRFYVPRSWRCWWDFGCGLLGDWACHTIDAPFWALGLGMPTAVEPEVRSDSPNGFIPDQSVIRFEFPASDGKSPVVLRWHEGGMLPTLRPEWGLEELGRGGMIMSGDKTSLMTGTRPDNPRLLLPTEEWDAFRSNPPAQTIDRIEGGPWGEWIAAIKGDGPTPGSSFDYASELTEMILLGVLAQRFNKRIEWDAENMTITNHPELNAFVKETVRNGWEYGEEVWK
jgi:predicted dehydrogenase